MLAYEELWRPNTICKRTDGFVFELLSDKVVEDLQDENLADKVLKAAEQKIKYKKK